MIEKVYYSVIGMVVLCILAVLTALVFLATAEPVTPAYNNGQMVIVVLTGEKGQVLEAFCSSQRCKYTVRTPNYKASLFSEFELSPAP